MERLRISPRVQKDAVGIYIWGKHGISKEQIFSDLEPYAKRLSDRLGEKIDTKDGFCFLKEKQGAGIDDEDKWPELARWLTEQLNLYRDTIAELSAAPADG